MERKPIEEAILDEYLPNLLPYRPLYQARSLIVTADADSEIRVSAELRCHDEEAARDGVTAAGTLLYVARHRLLETFGNEDFLKLPDSEPLKKLSRLAQQGLKTAVVEREKTTIQMFARFKIGGDALASAFLALQQQVVCHRASVDLRFLSLAATNFAAANSVLCGPAICDKDGKPLLSWRVTLLPYMEEFALYKQFKLDEPWDSLHNKKLLAKMPALYAPKGGKSKDAYSTHYRVFTGPNTLFDPKKTEPGPYGKGSMKIDSFFEIARHTIMIVEAAEAVLWTKPDELVYDPKKPLPKLGAAYPQPLFCHDGR